MCYIIYFLNLCQSLSPQCFVYEKWPEIWGWSGETGALYVRGRWVTWPTHVVLLGKKITSWEKTPDLSGLKHYTWDLKTLLSSQKLDGIISKVVPVDSKCKFMIHNSSPVILPTHQRRFDTVCQSCSRLMIDSSQQSGSTTRAVDLTVVWRSLAKKTFLVIQFVNAADSSGMVLYPASGFRCAVGTSFVHNELLFVSNRFHFNLEWPKDLNSLQDFSKRSRLWFVSFMLIHFNNFQAVICLAFGILVMTHPDFIETIQDILECPVDVVKLLGFW